MRVVIKFRESSQFVNLVADEFHEDGEFIKAYNGAELVGMFLIADIKAAYRTEQKN